MGKKLRLILGDQLNAKHSWYQKQERDTLYVMMEVRQETDYVHHHIQKVVAFFQSMRQFAQSLQDEGHALVYLTLDDERNEQDITKNLDWLIKEKAIEHFDYQLPDEYRLDKQIKKWVSKLKISHEAWDTEHFMTKREDLEAFFKGKKTYLMETFYRQMRKNHDILMDGKEPITGKWNYDHDNRNKLKDPDLIEAPLTFKKDVSGLVDMVRKAGVKTLGEIVEANFDWPTSRKEGLRLLDYFCEKLLPNFGTYQDAMHTDHAFLFHSRLSFALNSKMLSPLEVVKKVEQQWENHQDDIDISQAEGFIRQIIGWREYMRGIYWAKMPAFAELNFFEHKRALPDWYWTGKTKMNCLKHAIGQSLNEAYAHHIQRLMVTGNFALLAGCDPDEVDDWYLGIYIDAIEWVEITNTRGMSQFADGGIVGTKPYVSSANYIHKMSNYCTQCKYDKNKKYGENACPFNSLYWDFYDRHREKLENNPRIGMMYRTWEKMKPAEKGNILQQASTYLDQINDL
ncbi:cryptochrome/photolyase family protein [Pararhodonellum marinum]|uniref:cryptochrome/photolyase family protein n=1 Tax=Pararhodonellum marinum TaxID=2755358 RepID=UPI0018907406|nr:cryptochrome/photolyase family protein [Pararhodonellum marinum]